MCHCRKCLLFFSFSWLKGFRGFLLYLTWNPTSSAWPLRSYVIWSPLPSLNFSPSLTHHNPAHCPSPCFLNKPSIFQPYGLYVFSSWNALLPDLSSDLLLQQAFSDTNWNYQPIPPLSGWKSSKKHIPNDIRHTRDGLWHASEEAGGTITLWCKANPCKERRKEGGLSMMQFWQSFGKMRAESSSQSHHWRSRASHSWL